MNTFHPGEQSVQKRAGSFERMAQIGPHVIRGAMPEQHRRFFQQLPFIVIGAVDVFGQPWASVLVGQGAGFLHALDETHLRIDAMPVAGDPLAELLEPGADVGLLGIDLPTRRRNRLNGRVTTVNGRGLTVEVAQSFGNCPQYIQRRELLAPVAVSSGDSAPDEPVRHNRIDEAARQRIEGADTFFVASHAPTQAPRGSAGDVPSFGSDVSHRGGLPGFVQVSDDGRSLTWPDYSGNRFFNTLGNIAVQPRVGLVFPGFDDGSLLHVAGRAEVIWEGPELARFEGAERLVRMQVDEVVARPAAMPWRWLLTEISPSFEAPA
ncbi:pyridoxamine 5'-phosphate oxidase family protein [soil metagenome]